MMLRPSPSLASIPADVLFVICRQICDFRSLIALKLSCGRLFQLIDYWRVNLLRPIVKSVIIYASDRRPKLTKNIDYDNPRQLVTTLRLSRDFCATSTMRHLQFRDGSMQIDGKTKIDDTLLIALTRCDFDRMYALELINIDARHVSSNVLRNFIAAVAPTSSLHIDGDLAPDLINDRLIDALPSTLASIAFAVTGAVAIAGVTAAMLHRLASAPDSHISIGLTAATTITGEDIIEFIKTCLRNPKAIIIDLQLHASRITYDCLHRLLVCNPSTIELLSELNSTIYTLSVTRRHANYTVVDCFTNRMSIIVHLFGEDG